MDVIREATQTSVETPAPPVHLLFCIRCGKMVKINEGAVLTHEAQAPILDAGDLPEPTTYDCTFPDGYAFIAPPSILFSPFTDDLRLSAEEIEQAERDEQGCWEVGE